MAMFAFLAARSHCTNRTYTAPGTHHLGGFPCPSSMLNPECGEAAGQAATVTRAP
jgi:hypothetical protein